MRFRCANDLVVLRSCAPQRERWSQLTEFHHDFKNFMTSKTL